MNLRTWLHQPISEQQVLPWQRIGGNRELLQKLVDVAYGMW